MSTLCLAAQVFINGSKAATSTRDVGVVDTLRRGIQTDPVFAEVVRKFSVPLNEQRWEVISVFAGTRIPPRRGAFSPNFNVVPYDQTIKYVLDFYSVSYSLLATAQFP